MLSFVSLILDTFFFIFSIFMPYIEIENQHFLFTFVLIKSKLSSAFWFAELLPTAVNQMEKDADMKFRQFICLITS